MSARPASAPGPAPAGPRGAVRGARRGRRALAAALVVIGLAAPAFGWGDDAHHLITEEAVARLPEPLGRLLTEAGALESLKAASVAPDQWTKAGSPHYTPQERPRHWFDVDVLADEEPYPFTNFPRAPEAAAARLGPERSAQLGTGLWAVGETLEALADALRAGQTRRIFEQAGALAHYAADLHMPLHTTLNYDGQLTGNEGVHKAIEIGLIKRYRALYAVEVRKDRRVVAYVEDAREQMFAWVVASHARVGPILEADAAARAAGRYNPKEHEAAAEGDLSDLDDVESAGARPYYTALKEELDKRGEPVAEAMRDAAQHVARLLYTAWVRAEKPLRLRAAPVQEETTSALPYWLLGAALVIVLVILWPRRRPAPRRGP